MTSVNKSQPRAAVKIIGTILIVSLPFAFVALLELSGFMYLRSGGDSTFPLFFGGAQRGNQDEVFDTRQFMSTLDPILSHAQDSSFFEKNRSIPGFIIYGDESGDVELKLVTLGGSTTDPFSPGNWPEILAGILNEEEFHSQVLNGGVSGYSSNQELLKFIRDVEPIKPNVVVSLSGINDLGHLHSVINHPMIHPYQRRVFQSLVDSQESGSRILPNTIAALSKFFSLGRSDPVGLTFGNTNPIDPADQWLRNQRMMHTIAREFDISMVTILQPTLGIGAYTMDPEEELMLQKAIKGFEWRGDYLEAARSFYDQAREGLESIPNSVDLTDVFADKKGMYRDARHQTEAGCRVIAEVVFNELVSRDLISGHK